MSFCLANLHQTLAKVKLRSLSIEHISKSSKLQARTHRAYFSDDLVRERRTSLDSAKEISTKSRKFSNSKLIKTSDTINSQIVFSYNPEYSKLTEKDKKVPEIARSQKPQDSQAEEVSQRMPIQEFLDSDCGTSDTSDNDSSAESDLPFEQVIYVKQELQQFRTENDSHLPFGTPLSTAINMVHLPSEIASMNELGDRIDSIEQLPKLYRQESGFTKDSEKRKSHIDLESPTNKTAIEIGNEIRYRKISCGY